MNPPKNVTQRKRTTRNAMSSHLLAPLPPAGGGANLVEHVGGVEGRGVVNPPVSGRSRLCREGPVSPPWVATYKKQLFTNNNRFVSFPGPGGRWGALPPYSTFGERGGFLPPSSESEQTLDQDAFNTLVS